ncbi:hypothetical protein Tco_1069505 [Tanacetum coccineum]|uniref:Uncharacterized protein n=1 Tax=Tanacetum coccineum TaxID=301880 RepID=A0ABQ5HL01_9ASTR
MSAIMEARFAEHAAILHHPLLLYHSQYPTITTSLLVILHGNASGIEKLVLLLSLPDTRSGRRVGGWCHETARPPTPALKHWRTEEFEVRFEEAHDDRAYLGALVNTLYRERIQHHRTALAMDREAVYARIAWTSSEERSAAIEAHVRTLEAQVATLIAQTTSLQTQLTTALGRIATLEARDPEPQDGPAEAGSSS